MGASLSPLAVTARCSLAALLQPHIHSGFDTISVSEAKAVLGLAALRGDCQTPFPFPAEAQVRSRRAEMLQPLPLLVGASLVVDFCLKMF